MVEYNIQNKQKV